MHLTFLPPTRPKWREFEVHSDNVRVYVEAASMKWGRGESWEFETYLIGEDGKPFRVHTFDCSRNFDSFDGVVGYVLKWIKRREELVR